MSIIRSMNDETYTPCTKCGRPMAYCKGQCCGQPKGCECREYGPMKKGCIRQIEPSCPYEAVIPTLTVEDKSNIKDLADCFVHVSNINTTFYIDDKHRMIVTWAGPVEYDNYDLDANSLGLRSQFLIDHTNDLAAYYTKTGEYQVIGGPSEDSVVSITLSSYDEDSTSWSVASIMSTNIYEYQTESYGDNEYVAGLTVPSPVFTDDKTGETLSTSDIYGLLESGKEIKINGIPHIYAFSSRSNFSLTFAGTYDGVSGFSKADLSAVAQIRVPETQQYAASFSEHYATTHGSEFVVDPYIYDLSVNVAFKKTENNGNTTYDMVIPGLVFNHVVFA